MRAHRTHRSRVEAAGAHHRLDAGAVRARSCGSSSRRRRQRWRSSNRSGCSRRRTGWSTHSTTRCRTSAGCRCRCRGWWQARRSRNRRPRPSRRCTPRGRTSSSSTSRSPVRCRLPRGRCRSRHTTHTRRPQRTRRTSRTDRMSSSRRLRPSRSLLRNPNRHLRRCCWSTGHCAARRCETRSARSSSRHTRCRSKGAPCGRPSVRRRSCPRRTRCSPLPRRSTTSRCSPWCASRTRRRWCHCSTTCHRRRRRGRRRGPQPKEIGSCPCAEQAARPGEGREIWAGCPDVSEHCGQFSEQSRRCRERLESSASAGPHAGAR